MHAMFVYSIVCFNIRPLEYADNERLQETWNFLSLS